MKQISFNELGRRWVRVINTATDLKGNTLWVRRGIMEGDNEGGGIVLEHALMDKDGETILCKMVVGTDRRSWSTVYLIETNPKYRHQGWATMLLSEWKAEMEELEYKIAFWCPMNEEAEALAKKVGVEIV